MITDNVEQMKEIQIIGQTETMTSLQISEIVGKRHADLMRSIRNMEQDWERVAQRKFALGSYYDENNQPRPMYVLTKTECLYIASKFNNEARAKLVLRWEELERKERKEEYQSNIDVFDQKLKAASWVAGFLNMSAVSKLKLAKAVTSEFNLPLPEYVPSEGIIHSADYLLKKHNVGKSSQAFNQELIKRGFLREEQRPAKGGKVHKFKVITEKGLPFGRNDVNEKNMNETQPRWYDDKFTELLSLVSLNKQQSLDL